MKNFLSKLLILAAFVCCLVGFAACGEGSGSGGGNSGDTTDYSHTIIFYHTQGDKLQQKTAYAIAAFEAKYPGWKVEASQVGSYDDVNTKIISDLAGHIQPDLAYCYADHVAQYLKTGKVIDMNQYINSTEMIDTVVDGEVTQVRVGYTEEEIADFVPGYYAEGLASNYGNYDRYGFTANAMLTLPFSKSTELLYVNMDALVGAGLVDSQGKAKVATTWEELWEQAAVLKRTYPTCTPLGYDSEANWFITMCEQNDWGYTSIDNNNHYLFNNENMAGWLDQLNEYYDLGYVTTQEDYGSYTSNLFVKGTDGGAVYVIGSSGGASYQNTDDFEWGVYPIPGSANSTGDNPYAAISQGPSLVMLQTERSDNAEEKAKMTFLFIKELMDPAFQASFSIESGYCPVRLSTQDIEVYQEHMSGNTITAIAAKVAAENSERYYASPAFIGSSTARSVVGSALVYAMIGQKTGEQALREAYRDCGGR